MSEKVEGKRRAKRQTILDARHTYHLPPAT